ncbi:hypothetical protein PWG71_20945 [Nocardiopsis sp. N85]|uniref:hypothetical protein n=1 Tax=Nocardiopsis sp. N85 TaxID=3029400 RepID=UPI00237FB711|nr:hypothetical protein [Nocardiopsis sp. N85]MDE3723866.1 hypothetical protein [Nocardiopsis sp. N85]
MRRTVIFARLTLFNTLRLVRGPFLLPGALLTALYVWVVSNEFSSSVEEWYSILSLIGLLLGAVGFAAVTPSAVREARYPGTSTTPLERTGRTLSVALAALPPLWLLLGAIALFMYTDDPGGPVGIVSPFALPVPFLMVAAGPLASLLLSVWTRSYLPLIIVALCLPVYLVYNGFLLSERFNNAVSRATTAAQQVISPFQNPSVSLAEPTLFSLVYTLLMTGMLTALVVGARRRGRVLVTSTVTAVVLGAGAFGVTVQGNRANPWDRSYADDEVYGVDGPAPCLELDGLTYCPLPGYEPWAENWHSTLSEVLGELPASAREGAPLVWQDALYYDRSLPETDRPVLVLYDDLDPDWAYWQGYVFLDFLRKALGMAISDTGPYGDSFCRSNGQARTPVIAWVVDTVTSRHGLEGLDRADSLAGVLSELTASPIDLEVARALTERPHDEVSAVVHGHWDRIASGEMSTPELARELEIPITDASTEPAPGKSWDAVFPELEKGVYQAWDVDSPPCAPSHRTPA